MNLRPLSPAIGAEVTGLSASEIQAGQTLDEIRAAFERYRLLLFRDQRIAPEQQKAFAECFAPTIGSHVTRPEDGLMFVSNRERGGAVGDGTLPFHSDHTFFQEPDTTVLALYAIAVPSTGGDTLWVDAMQAYEDLPLSLKKRIVGLSAAHTFKRYDDSIMGAVHPLARLLPDRGRPILFIDEFCKTGIEEMQNAEGDALLAELFAHLYREERYYRHKWRVGDFILWDNRILQHARTDFDPTEERTLRRSTQGVPERVVAVNEVPA